MISQQRILHYNNGFSLIEVLITVLIVGIISSIGIPLYNHMKTKYDQTEVDSTALILQSDFSKAIEEYNNISNFKYPLQGKVSSNGSTSGYYNISDADFLNCCNILIVNSPTLNDNETIQSKTLSKGTIVNYQSIVTYTFVFKSGNQLIFEFKYIDNKLSYGDIASLSSFTYINNKGVSKTIPMI